MLSQVVFSLQLPFAVVPLILFTTDKRDMGECASSRFATMLAALVPAAIIAPSMKLVYDSVTGPI